MFLAWTNVRERGISCKRKAVETGIDGWRRVPHGGLGSITGFSLKPVPKSGVRFRGKSGYRETAKQRQKYGHWSEDDAYSPEL
jgi:hypothetical protein